MDVAHGEAVAIVPPAFQADETDEIVPPIDFSTDPEGVRVVAEGERMSYGHLFNPAFPLSGEPGVRP